MKFVFLCAVLLGASLSGAEFAEREFITLSGELSPEVRLALRQEGDDYTLRLEAENAFAGVSGTLGAARTKTKMFEIRKFPAELKLNATELGNGPLRLALRVDYWNAERKLRQREVFLAQSVGGGFAENSSSWPIFDYAAYRALVEDRAQKILLPVSMKNPGKLTVVVEDEHGNRIRNLVSGIEYAAGTHRIHWDGFDELGNLAAPGKYRYRTAAHPGIEPKFMMQFANGEESMFVPFGANHGTMTALAANGKYVFAAAPITEGGWAIIAMTPEGKFVRGFPQIGGCGIEEVFLAADAEKLYVVNDGRAWGRNPRPPQITLSVYEIETGKIVQPDKKRQYSALYDAPAGEPDEDLNWEQRQQVRFQRLSLRGAALCNGILYISNARTQQLMAVDPATGNVTASIGLPRPGVVASGGGKLFAFSERKLVEVDITAKTFRPLFEFPESPRGLFTPDGKTFYIPSSASHTIRVCDASGKETKTLGVPGGPYSGRWIAERLINPIGVAIAPDGSLWATEDRRNPKRLSRWDTRSGKVLYSKIGSPAYGSPAVGFDPQKPTRWIGQRVLWELNFADKSARVTAVLQKEAGHFNGKIPECYNYRIFHRAGRTFVVGSGKCTIFSELLPDGTLKDIAAISSGSSMLYALGWKRIPAFSDPFEKAFPKANFAKRYNDPSCAGAGILWVDKNGDGDWDADEFEFTPPGSRFGSFYWGARIDSFDFMLNYITSEGENRLISMRPDGFNAVGAPNYSFARALKETKLFQFNLPAGSRSYTAEPLNDPSGNLVVNTTPFMFSFSPEGKLNWLYKNPYTGVHGSHKAPLPKPGDMQGILYSLGCAPLDKEGDLMLMLGNHGRIFVLTTDGLYLDEMFADCRVAAKRGPGLIGGEPFGGVFGYDEVSKRYLLSAGTSGYRIYQLAGVDQMRRSTGTVEVTKQMIDAAVREQSAVAETVLRQTNIPRLKGGRIDWGKLPDVARWGQAVVRGAYDDKNLYLQYQVVDASPWVNFGADWTRLFKTGDAVDFQIGTNSAAPADRREAVPGDVRVSVAPFEKGSQAVLYRYRLTDKTGANPVEFASPWRSERVDDVRKIGTTIKLAPQIADGSYRINLAFSLKDLGLINPAGKTFRGDFGVIFGDRDGTVNLSRSYWSNQATGLVNDVPGETMLTPRLWGEIKFGE